MKQLNNLAPEISDTPSVDIGDNIVFNKMKVCTKCKMQKEESCFPERTGEKDKYGNIRLRKDCKKCVCERAKEYYAKNPEKVKKNSKEWGKKNPEMRKKSQRDWEHRNKEKISSKRKTPEWMAKSKVRREKTKDIRNAKRRQYYLDHPEKAKELNERVKENRKLNPKKYRERDKENYHKNKHKPEVKEKNRRQREKRKPKRNTFEVKKREKNPLYRMTLNLRARTSKVFKKCGYAKNSKTEETLGTNYETVKKHLERQFLGGMSWDNYGRKSGLIYWEVDHIIPLSSAKTIKDLILLCHYTNLQPLWSEDNNKKNNKIIPTQMKIAI